MASSADRPDDETPDWLVWCFDWFGARTREGDQMNGSVEARIHDLQKRFDAIGWGLLFLFLAALALPSGNAEYVSVATLGGLMLALNVVRIARDVPIRWFSVILGTSMLVGGGAAVLGVRMDLFVVFFVLAGLVTIAGAFRRSNTITSPDAN